MNVDPYKINQHRFESNVDSFILSDLFHPLYKKDEELVEDIKNNKIVIYTAFSGGYDSLKDPEYIDENCDYICFCEEGEEIESDIWEIRPLEKTYFDNNRKAKIHRLFPHIYLPEYEYSFWFDGTFRIKGSIREYIYKYVNSPILAVVHPERDCVYDEALGSISFERYSNYGVCKQVRKYKEEGLPKHFGIIASGALFRQHNNPEVISLMEQWWEEIIKYTNQDQLSFSYVMWKNNYKVSVGPVNYWQNEYWSREGLYQHKQHVTDYITSKNLIKKLENNIQDVNSLTKEKLSLLINDIDSLQDECLALNEIRNNIDREINNLKDSKSWKLTEPLRKKEEE